MNENILVARFGTKRCNAKYTLNCPCGFLGAVICTRFLVTTTVTASCCHRAGASHSSNSLYTILSTGGESSIAPRGWQPHSAVNKVRQGPRVLSALHPPTARQAGRQDGMVRGGPVGERGVVLRREGHAGILRRQVPRREVRRVRRVRRGRAVRLWRAVRQRRTGRPWRSAERWRAVR